MIKNYSNKIDFYINNVYLLATKVNKYMTDQDLSKYKFTDIRYPNSEYVNGLVFLEGRVDNIKMQKNYYFITLRYQFASIQVICYKPTEIYKIPLESIVKVYGILKKTPVEVKATSCKWLEVHAHHIEITSESDKLMFQLKDANNFGESEIAGNVDMNNRLNFRWLDLRVPVNLSIFRIKSNISLAFREFLIKNDFIEINTPKIIGVASESGSDVFELKYFDKTAYLAQSPQLYKQLAINADFDRVFEIGPVFRSEKAFTNRHLCEFTGMDLEMTIDPDKDYYQVMHMIWNLLVYIFDYIEKHCEKEMNIINEKLPFDRPVYTADPLIISFKDGVEMLNNAGIKQDHYEDLNTENEKKLGALVKEKYGLDIFILNEYPAHVRPFYTMPNSKNERYSNSFDIIFRGQEICSGAQRINDYKQLMSRVTDFGINPESLKDYLQSFSNGSKRHGGCGFGLERLTSFYLGLNNIRMASFCPRDPKRIVP